MLSNIGAASASDLSTLSGNFTSFKTTTASAFSSNQQSGTITLVKSGNIRQLVFDDAKLPANATFFTFSTLPSEDRPKALTGNVLRKGSGSDMFFIWVRTTGTFGFGLGTAGEIVNGSLTWVV